jgi:hypothetical protein
MRYVYFAFTVLLQFSLIKTIRPLENLFPLTFLFIGFLVTGLFLSFGTGKEKIGLRSLGWGLLFGSLTTLVVTITFILWLSELLTK